MSRSKISGVRAQLLHLDGPRRGRTITYGKPRLLFGSAEDADIRYSAGLTVKPRHAEIVLDEERCAFHLRALEGEVFVNHREVEEVVLEPNDLIEVGRLGPKVRFRIHDRGGRSCKPVLQMIRDAREVGAVSGIYALTRSMGGDLVKHATPRFRAGFLAIVAVLAVGVAYLGGWIGGRQSAGDTEAAHAREIARLQAELEQLREQDNVSRGEIDKVRGELTRHTLVVDDLLRRDAALRQVLDVYSRGVCLLHGIFTLNNKNSKGELKPLLGRGGKPLELEYVGSGFLASAEGHVVTNRHVAEPWWNNPRVAPLIERGLVPSFVLLDAIFPGRAPVAVDRATIRISPDGVDVAVFKVPAAGLPVLPLYDGEVALQRGKPIVLLGYPTGVNALLARAESEEVAEMLQVAGTMTALIAELAKRGAISPIITQGALNEVKSKRLVYDADTTSGGSGGPVFGPNGTVIGINFAITRDFGGSNFGVPIRFAKKLLPAP